MQTVFDTLIDSYIENKVGIADNFLSPSLAASLKQNLMSLFDHHQLRDAGIGNETKPSFDKKVRGDQIYWLDRNHHNQHENIFFDLMDKFIAYLNSTCYSGITGYEFHYTLYEKDCFYKKHVDQFRNNKSRAYSMIMYLNTDWQLQDGGELCIHHAQHTQNISPVFGKSVFFKSDELEHEVLVTHKPRMSITGWLKVD